MDDDGHGAADSNTTGPPHDADPYQAQYANWPYADPGANPGGFVAIHSHDGNMETSPLQVLDAVGQTEQYLTPPPPLAVNTASHGSTYGGGQWPASSAQTDAWVDNQVSNTGYEASSSSTDATPYAYQSEFFASNNAIPAAYPSYPSSFTSSYTSYPSTSPWATTASSLSPTPSSQQQPQDWAATAAAAGPASDKAPPVKKKRGRPRVYEDDGTEAPKRTPGRPPVYSFASSSSASSASKVSPATAAASAPNVPVVPGTNRTRQSSKDEDAKQSSVRARNKAAATRYRQKTQAAIAEMEAEEREASATRQALIACAGKLREEVFQLKNEVLRHADCGCPLIEGYLSQAAQQAAMNLGETSTISQGMGAMSLAGTGTEAGTGAGAGDARVMHLEECNLVFGDGGYYEGGYVEGWQGLGTDGAVAEGVDGDQGG